MPEYSKSQTSMTRLGVLTGLVTGGSMGWILYRIFKSEHLDYSETIKDAALFAGMMGVCLTTSAVILECRNSTENRKKSISKKGASNLTVPVCKTSSIETLMDRVNEWDRMFTDEANNGNVSNKKILRNNILDLNEATSKYEDLTKRLNDLNRQLKGNELETRPTVNLMKSYCNEGFGSSKTKFKEKIISLIHELKGYVQGTIYPLPLARKIQFRSTEMNEETSEQIAMIVREYANSMLLEFEKVTDEFVSSVSETGKVLNNKELKLQNAFKTLGILEKDLSVAPLKVEMDQYYKALEKATKTESQLPCENGKRPCNESLANAKPLEQERIIWSKYSELQSPQMPKLESPTGVSMQIKPQVTNPDQPEEEKIKNSLSKPSSKLVLTQEQLGFLNILKSEL